MATNGCRWTIRQMEEYRSKMAKYPQPVFGMGKRADSANKRHRNDHGAPNGTEDRFNREILQGKGIYEALTFRLPGVNRRPVYTPDWVVFTQDGCVKVYEVKGEHRFHSEGRASTAFEIAAAMFPKVQFNWAKLTKSGWVWKAGEPPTPDDLGL